MELASIISNIQELSEKMRASCNVSDLKNFAYHIAELSYECWELYTNKERAEVNYKIKLWEETDKLVKTWLSYNKAQQQAEQTCSPLYVKSKKALSEYKKSMLIKEAYVNFMRACKLEISEWKSTDIMWNAFSNINID